MRAITDAREFSEALNRLSQLLPQSSFLRWRACMSVFLADAAT